MYPYGLKYLIPKEINIMATHNNLTNEAPFSKPLEISLRVIWLVLAAFLLVFFIGGLPLVFQDLSQTCEINCRPLKITSAEAAMLHNIGLSLSFYAGFHVFVELIIGVLMAGLAILIFVIRFHEKMGAILSFMLFLVGLNFLLEGDMVFVTHYPIFQAPFNIISSITIVPLLLLFYMFPDGRFTPRWTAWLIIPFTIFLTLVSFYDEFLSDPTPTTFQSALTLLFVFSLLLGFVSQIYRYFWISGTLQKQQTKWVLLGFSGFIFVVINYYLWFVLFTPSPGFLRLFLFSGYYGLMALLLALFPITFVIAIMRYRLWDIDVIIRRTLLYSLLSALLAGVYFSAVVVMQNAITAVGGQQSAVAVVISTLLTAALFNPFRQRLQTFIDRRFYRQKYDAEQILANFAQTARDEVELETLRSELVNVVQETVQPAQITVWLQDTKNR